jgi:hypothetical protein
MWSVPSNYVHVHVYIYISLHTYLYIYYQYINVYHITIQVYSEFSSLFCTQWDIDGHVKTCYIWMTVSWITGAQLQIRQPRLGS